MELVQVTEGMMLTAGACPGHPRRSPVPVGPDQGLLHKGWHRNKQPCELQAIWQLLPWPSCRQAPVT